MAFGQHLAHTNPREILIAEKRQQETPLPSKENLQVFIGKVSEIIVARPETGFFIAKMTLPKNELPPKLTFQGKPWLGRIYTVKGISKGFLDAERIGSEVECYGTWEEDPQYGLQFSAVFVNEKLPNSPEALTAFLSSGKIHGLGAHYAKQIVKKWGVGAIDIFDHDPQKLKEIPGIGDKKLETIIKSWGTYRSVYKIMSFMQMHGIGDAVYMRIYNAFGENAIEVIEKNPYALTHVPLVGFRTADRIAKSLGISSESSFRIKASLKFILEESSKNEGNTALPFQTLVERAADLLELDDLRPIETILNEVVQSEQLISRKLKVKMLFRQNFGAAQITETEVNCISPKGLVTTEKNVALDILRLLNRPSAFTNLPNLPQILSNFNMGLDPTQEKAVLASFGKKVSIITGGPGTGKTHTIKSVLKLAQSQSMKVTLCAPTGRAAKRMEESTSYKASTIHRLLGFIPNKGFSFDENNRLDLDLLIVDESSMIDIWLLSALLRAMPDHGHIILVGDVDQLPSVGAGNCLSDLIMSNQVPCSRLMNIHRQAQNSRITLNAHKIIKKQFPELPHLSENLDFAFIEADTNEKIQEEVLKLCSNLISTGVHPDRIQVLSPQKSTEVGTEALNQKLRPVLNSQAKDWTLMLEDGSKLKFAPGDRVMQFRNNYGLELFNGDVGVVDLVDTDDGSISVLFDDDRLIELSGAHLKDIRLAYAITIHKSQGTEHEHVIIPMTRSHQFMFTPNLLYTAVTRGKTRVYLIGEKQVIYRTVTANNRDVRITGLMYEMNQIFNLISGPF